MRIAQLSATYSPVTKQQNKAIYSHIAWLTDCLTKLGHEITLFASSDSKTEGKLHSVDFEVNDSWRNELKRYEQWSTISECYREANKGNFDLIHSHFNIMSAMFADLTKTPTLISIHSPIEDWMRPILNRYKHLNYVSFSHSQRKQMPELNWVATIYHGVDTDQFTFNPEPEDYFLFLGRITEEKGAADAIEAAKLADVPLRLAGRSYSTEKFWHDSIEPHINGEDIRFFGEACFEKKIELLQKAKALIFPTKYAEVFGYVMIEAMSCGTPVIAYGNGSVPEIVKNGKTGFVVSDVAGIAEAIKKIDQIDRKEVRKRVETFFSIEKMVKGYEAVYKKIIAKTPKSE